MLKASAEICRLFNADRLTLYGVNEDWNVIVAKVKTGLNASKRLKLAVSVQSIAGSVAMKRQLLNVVDVYDSSVLQAVHSSSVFLMRLMHGVRKRDFVKSQGWEDAAGRITGWFAHHVH